MQPVDICVRHVVTDAAAFANSSRRWSTVRAWAWRDVCTHHLAAKGAGTPTALTSGFRKALVAASIFVLAAAAIGTRTARRDVLDPSVLVNG
jgi:hypothetical protein